MTIKSPETYGDEYFASQLDAQTTFEDELEKSIAPFIPSIFGDPEIRESIPFDILSKLEGLLAFESPGLAGVGGRFVSEVADQAVSMVMTPALRKTQYASNRLFHNLIMSPDQATALFRRKRLMVEDFDYRMKAAGFDQFELKFAYDASAPFPTIPELFRWGRYHGDPDNTWATLQPYVDLDPIDYPKWEWLTKQQLTTDQVTALFKRGALTEDESKLKLRELGWSADVTDTIKDLSYAVPNAMLLVQGDLFAQVDQDKIFTDLGKADIHPDFQQKYFDAVLTKPSSSDLVAYHLRQENKLADLDGDLKRIGIHPGFTDVYRTLADRIPPLADMITMAVREAFSPEIAKRFGQYEDFPKEFGKYAEQQGLSKEWSERYWAAHWGLPSVTQGFNMLHRGIIREDELQMLLRAQDVMPFWRDKLVEIAYRPFTRIDVRRMYKEGVLDEKGVYQAYLDLGYQDEKAQKMTEFVISQTLSSMSKFTTADVVKAYTDRMIDKSDTRTLLRMLGVRSADVSYILSTADYKKEWELSEAKIRAIRNLYKRGEYEENQTRSELLRLDLPSEQVEVLMQQWWYEKKEDEPATWTKAETLRFLKVGLITQGRASKELQAMGYDSEHINVYLRSVTWTPPES